MSNENKEQEVMQEMETERREYKEMLSLLVNIQKDYTRSNKMKDWIIIVLILVMLIEGCVGYAGFLWWESQWDYTESVTTEVYTEGDNANAEYNDNDVTGDQYNDSTFNELPNDDEEEGNEE